MCCVSVKEVELEFVCFFNSTPLFAFTPPLLAKVIDRGHQGSAAELGREASPCDTSSQGKMALTDTTYLCILGAIYPKSLCHFLLWTPFRLSSPRIGGGDTGTDIQRGSYGVGCSSQGPGRKQMAYSDGLFEETL